MSEKKKRVILFLVEAMILAAVFFAILVARRNPFVLRVSMDQWSSVNMNYENGSWYIHEGDISQEDFEKEQDPMDQTVCILYGPFVELPRGSYTVTATYDCDEDQKLIPYANNGYDAFVKSGTCILSKNQNTVSYRFYTTEDLDNFEVAVRYNGEGDCQISSISVVSNTDSLKRVFVILAVLFVLADLVYIFRHWIRRNKKEILLLSGILFLASLPLLVGGVDGDEGEDLMFHLLRIEGIAQELRNGQFPVYMQSLWMEGYGYPVSMYYGDMLLYLPALLRLAGFSVIFSYKCYVFLINVGTLICTYLCCKKIFRSEKAAIVCCAGYMTATYRMVNIYIRAAVGEYTAMMFLPVIALSVYLIYTEDAERWQQYKKGALFLAVGMTGLIQTHVLTTEMVVLVLLLICLIFLKKTFRKNTIRLYVLAVVETFLLNLYFIVPFLDYYLNVPVAIRDNMHVLQTIQKEGAFPAQYFAFFQEPFGGQITLQDNILSFTPGLLLMGGLIFACYLWGTGKAGKAIKGLTVFSIFFLFIASNLCPWDFVVRHIPLGNFLGQVQFPWRYIGFANLTLALLLGVLVLYFEKNGSQQYQRAFYRIVSGACAFICVLFVSQYIDGAELVNYRETEELNTHFIVKGEYLRSGSSEEDFTYNVSGNNAQDIEVLQRRGSSIDLYCEIGPEGGSVTLPVLNYKGYVVTDDDGNTYEIVDSENKEIQVQLPENFQGELHIRFEEPWYWRVSEGISLFMLIGMMISVLWWRKRKRSLER